MRHGAGRALAAALRPIAVAALLLFAVPAGAAAKYDVVVYGAKAAGVSYAVGRESRSRHGESLAGRRETLPGNHQFKAAVSPFDDEGRLAPYVVRQEDLAPLGEGDGKIQAYCFRLCLTDVEENQVPIDRPRDYGSPALRPRAELPEERRRDPHLRRFRRHRRPASHLLVTSCISASAIAYASFRMEPQFMIAGHSAEVAAAQAVRSASSLHALDLPRLQRRLLEQRQILSHPQR